ncbi:MAG TPA: matrixin family metalloprotease [Acinetobacter parvus]|jgi:chromosome segregation ATPase|uniref:matrixin family metalloprotease n=1 Tax=Acinetobacter parvus TaxID=134533 RepID=UPI002D0557C3|nr:matrixin family metalloprotease [Acinetobacter parvus]HRM16144.1 matrixin family metalloprotease [Acinetobacter parvus]
MLRIVTIIFLIGLSCFSIYQLGQTSSNSFIDRFLNPFDSRIRYRIGEVDPRFSITQTQLQQLAFEATQIWQQAEQKDYFIYDPKAKLSIHLIYDERQAESNSRQEKMNEIETKQMLWQQRHLQAEQLKQKIYDLEQQLTEKREQLNQQANQYNQQVQHINARGGASTAQRFALEEQKLYLIQQQQHLQNHINQHNQKIDILNQEVKDLNALNQQLSIEVSGFNAQFSGKQFDKGTFNGRSIHIYEFSSPDDLRLTLAHEFGHALGLGHHDDPYGLMHPILQKQDSKNFQLSGADLQLLSK